MEEPQVDSPGDGAVGSRVQVGIVGLGRMGMTIAKRLCSLGVPVRGWNRTLHRGRELTGAGGVLVDSPADVAASVDLLLCAVSGPRDVEEVLLGPNGVYQSARPGLTVVDLSTIDPQTSSAVAAALARNGIAMLDAPLSGSVHDAERGTLGLLVGGDPAVLARVQPTLQHVGCHVYYFGSNGAGCAAKLALNLLLGAMIESLAEALAYLQANQLPTARFLEAVSTSGLSSPMFERTGKRALARDFAPRFALRHLHKDLSILAAQAERFSGEPRLASILVELVSRDVDVLGDSDYSVLIAARRPEEVNHAGAH